DPAAAPHRPRRRRADPEADPRRLRPPAQVAGPLARARRAGQPRPRPSGAGRARAARRRPRRGAGAGAVRRPLRQAARLMLLHVPAKLNLCLYLGAVREDGLHDLCSLFEPLALADLIEVTPAERDEVICSGVEGENLATRALVALRERGWEGEPLRIEIEKRVPIAAGLGGGSGDAAAILRLAAGAVA